VNIFYVIENRQTDDDPNEIPDRRQMASAPQYWNWVSQILGASLGGHHETEDQRIAALRRNAEHFDAQRRPSVISEIVAEVVDHVLAALPRPIKQAMAKPSAKDAARDWLVAKLAGQLGGQLGAVELESMAKAAGISMRTLRRAAESAGIRHVKNPDKTWSWRLIQAKSKPSAAP